MKIIYYHFHPWDSVCQKNFSAVKLERYVNEAKEISLKCNSNKQTTGSLELYMPQSHCHQTDLYMLICLSKEEKFHPKSILCHKTQPEKQIRGYILKTILYELRRWVCPGLLSCSHSYFKTCLYFHHICGPDFCRYALEPDFYQFFKFICDDFLCLPFEGQ